jgi:hypothetical protein
MTENAPNGMDPYEFILQKIDSVPQLEALVLLWNNRPAGWTRGEPASRLYMARSWYPSGFPVISGGNTN